MKLNTLLKNTDTNRDGEMDVKYLGNKELERFVRVVNSHRRVMGIEAAKLGGEILWSTLKSKAKEFGICLLVWGCVCKNRKFGVVAVTYSRVSLAQYSQNIMCRIYI